MLRTLRAEAFTGEVAFLHYARAAEEACYRDELAEFAATPGVRVLHGYTRDGAEGDLDGRFGADHLGAAMPGGDPEAVFVCGPPALVDAVRLHCPDAISESFVPPTFAVPTDAIGGTGSRSPAAASRRPMTAGPLLAQAEAAGLSPESGCRMGICHSCTRFKRSGAVSNLITGAVSTADCGKHPDLRHRARR